MQPSRNSIAIHGIPSQIPSPTTRTIPGWDSRRSIAASRRRHAISAAVPVRGVFIATIRLFRVESAKHTPHPALGDAFEHAVTPDPGGYARMVSER
jgi:hypothetical protein